MSAVYANQSQDRFFHIPDDANLPAGRLELRSLRGTKLSVDPASAVPFEVTEDQAKQLVKEELSGFTKKAAGALSAVGEVLRSVGAHRPIPTTQNKSDAPAQVVADALGVTPEQLREDPAAVKAGISTMMDGLLETIKAAVSDAPASREATERRLAALATALGDSAPDTDKIRESLDKFRGTLRDPGTVEKVRRATEQLEQATARLRDSEQKIRDEIDGIGDDDA